jgi:hypothetical protein
MNTMMSTVQSLREIPKYVLLLFGLRFSTDKKFYFNILFSTLLICHPSDSKAPDGAGTEFKDCCKVDFKIHTTCISLNERICQLYLACYSVNSNCNRMKLFFKTPMVC